MKFLLDEIWLPSFICRRNGRWDSP